MEIGVVIDEADAAGAAGGAPAVQDASSLQLASEPADAYYRRVFDEFVSAKKQAGEKTDGVTFESFRAKLAQHEAVA